MEPGRDVYLFRFIIVVHEAACAGYIIAYLTLCKSVFPGRREKETHTQTVKYSICAGVKQDHSESDKYSCKRLIYLCTIAHSSCLSRNPPALQQPLGLRPPHSNHAKCFNNHKCDAWITV